jgi:2-polyprenyl-6-methoxyphenol hydroxylase-like FAD-dependent oxidoreductase
MRPNLGQGACTAVEDAVVLAQTLKAIPDAEQALRRFERLRRRRVRWIRGWSEITSRLQLIESTSACRLRDVYLWLQPGPLLAQAFMRPILNFRRARRPA